MPIGLSRLVSEQRTSGIYLRIGRRPRNLIFEPQAMNMNMLPRTDSTVWHEASHAASLCLSGLVPVLVRCDWPTQTQLGSVRFDWTAFEPSELVMREILVSLLQGPLAEGEVLDHWDWPIDPDAVTPECRKDAEQAAFVGACCI